MKGVSLLLVVLLVGCAGAAGTREPSASGLAGPPPTPSALPSSPMQPRATPGSPMPPASPRSTPKPTPVGVPPKPTGVTFDVQERDLGGDRFEKTATVTWRSPRDTGVTITVYGVTECLSAPPDAEGPCLAEHSRLPSSVLRLAAAASASDGTATWTWTWIEDWSGPGCQWYPPVSGPDGNWYASVVLAAYTASGHSIFAIADPWWSHGPGFFFC